MRDKKKLQKLTLKSTKIKRKDYKSFLRKIKNICLSQAKLGEYAAYAIVEIPDSFIKYPSTLEFLVSSYFSNKGFYTRAAVYDNKLDFTIGWKS